MTKWVRQNILEEDEDEVYYKLLDKVSVWTEREDIVYEKEVIAAWNKGQAERGVAKVADLLPSIEHKHLMSHEKGRHQLLSRVEELK